eukprot:14749190-Alexandrium_andersonii.AAC.1
MAVVSVTQTSAHSKPNTECMSTLLKGSRMVDLVAESIIWAAERRLIQGFPHPRVPQVTPDLARFFPFRASAPHRLMPAQSACAAQTSAR